MKQLLLALAALIFAGAPAAATDYSFSYGFGGVTYASGTITADDTGYFAGSRNVTGVAGQHLGDPISGFQDFFDVDFGDQQIYPAQAAAYVSDLGLTFQVGDYSYTITAPSFSSGGNGTYTEYRYLTADPFGPQQSQFVSFFTLSQVAVVPEPETWAMMLFGFGMIGVIRRQAPSAGRAFPAPRAG